MIQVTLNQGAGILMQFIMVILPLLQDLEVEHVSSQRSILELRSIVRRLRRPEQKHSGDQCRNQRPFGNLRKVSKVRRSDQGLDRRPEARKLVQGSETRSEIGDEISGDQAMTEAPAAPGQQDASKVPGYASSSGTNSACSMAAVNSGSMKQ